MSNIKLIWGLLNQSFDQQMSTTLKVYILTVLVKIGKGKNLK